MILERLDAYGPHLGIKELKVQLDLRIHVTATPEEYQIHTSVCRPVAAGRYSGASGSRPKASCTVPRVPPRYCMLTSTVLTLHTAEPSVALS
jgi:hypothetical protein